MKDLDQLKTIRDAAMTRLLDNLDYRMMTSLDQLIFDLEASGKAPAASLSVVEQHATATDTKHMQPAPVEGKTEPFETSVKEAAGKLLKA
ncbi:MAG: hypothetical protein AAF412_08110 [Pseudomonadota bacterium]